MSSESAIGNEVGVAQPENVAFDEDGFEVVDEVAERTRNLRPSVEMEVRAKVDTNHPDAGHSGLTLEAEERVVGRELELARTRVRIDRRQESDREARTRAVASAGSRRRRRGFGERAASVDPWAAVDGVDARERLSQDELGAVNREAGRMSAKLPRWSSAAISRVLAERVADGADVLGAVVSTYEELLQADGQVIPIGALEDVPRSEVSVEGRVKVLWKPSHAKIAQVGLVEDDTGVCKVTVWKASEKPAMREGERVRIRDAKKSWYEGRVSLAVTGWSEVQFPSKR